MCVYVCICTVHTLYTGGFMYSSTRGSAHAHICGGQRLTSRVLLDHFSSYLPVQGLRPNVELTVSATLATHIALGVFCVSFLGSQIASRPPYAPHLYEALVAHTCATSN